MAEILHPPATTASPPPTTLALSLSFVQQMNHLSLTVVLCLASALWIGAEAVRGRESCPAGWSQLGCNCFRYFGSQMSWADAEHHCIGQGGNLASIHSDAEHQFIRGLIRSASGADRRTYVGGHDSYKARDLSALDRIVFHFINKTDATVPHY
ncbi:galactose-specific lectin nattectin-like [Synchiropus splendidus]|uniref:galactose-specific lectin nattectin-like n=1 Tax=Synchiropus splendidus TaxID=270530 RepID=UPI00237DCB92|nr:galactose-specific lectin nattectin-like [Synchiropus splendidus]